MAGDLRFDGQVVIVTCAGAGLGRAYALLFGLRGASVVVNDPGVTESTVGSSEAADAVVNEIVEKGGKAVADYNSVVDGGKIVQTALDNFGRIDIVVNNADIIRDKPFARINNTDWDLIQDVHLKGAFKTTQAAWPHFRQQKYGKVIVTSSNSGLYGNIGQANYCAAKLGLVGLGRTIAVEGGKYNINCNVIVPTAASSLTEGILPPDLFAELKPELIAPVVVWLCHKNCTENGSVIESAAGWATKYTLIRGQGAILRKDIKSDVTPEDVRNHWKSVIDMTNAEVVESMQGATGALMTHLEKLRTGDIESNRMEIQQFQILNSNCITYALGIGASINNKLEVKYLYEKDSDFTTFPTMAIIPSQLAVKSSRVIFNAIPGQTIDLSQVPNEENYLELYRPLPTSGIITSECHIVEIIDDGIHAAIVAAVESFDSDGNKLCYAEFCTAIVNGGGFGGKRSQSKRVPPQQPPSTQPDQVVKEKISDNQAVLYRMSGDLNPLHIDPSFANDAGYSKPILHHLCSLGFSARHVLNTYAGGNPLLFKAIKAKFLKPCYPGDTLCTEMWRSKLRIYFQTKVADTNDVIIGGAFVDLQAIPEPIPSNPVAMNNTLPSDAIFGFVSNYIKACPNVCKKINAIFLYRILNNGVESALWTVDAKSGKVYGGEPENAVANTTLIIEDSDIMKLTTGELNQQDAFVKGLLKIEGNYMLAQKMNLLILIILSYYK